MKIKCCKLKCEVCGVEGTAQVFYNKAGQLRYGRVRHYLKLNESKKPVFEYHAQSKEYLTEKVSLTYPEFPSLLTKSRIT